MNATIKVKFKKDSGIFKKGKTYEAVEFCLWSDKFYVLLDGKSLPVNKNLCIIMPEKDYDKAQNF